MQAEVEKLICSALYRFKPPNYSDQEQPQDYVEEQVRVVKVHSQQEGGGFTIFVPSLNRERQTVAGRLKFSREQRVVATKVVSRLQGVEARLEKVRPAPDDRTAKATAARARVKTTNKQAMLLIDMMDAFWNFE